MYTVLLCFTLLIRGQFCDGRTANHVGKMKLFPGRVVPRFDFMSNCYDFTPIQFENVTFENNKVGISEFINSDIKVQRLINKPIKKVITYIQNCEDSTVSTCQVFQTWRFYEETCPLMEAKDTFWETIYRSLQPPIKCPIFPSVYLLRNATFNMKLMNHLPIPFERYYWRVRVEAYDPDLFICMKGGGKFMRTFT